MSNAALNVAILEYLRTTYNDNPSMEVAIQCLGEALELDMDKSETKEQGLSSRSLTLPAVFEAGLKALTSGSSASSSSSEYAVWNKYLENLVKLNAFAGKSAGTPEHDAVMKRIAEKFVQKHASEPLPADIRALLGGNKPAAEPDANAIALAEKYKAEGNDHFKAKDYAKAITSYSKAIDTNPTNAIYWLNRAVARINTSLYADAKTDCEAAIKLDSKYTKAFYRLGQCHMALNEHQSAVEALEKAMEYGKSDEALLPAIREQLALARSHVSTPAIQKAIDGLSAEDTDAVMNAAKELKDDPMAQELATDPKMQAIMAEVQRDGLGAAMKYMSDPEFMAKMQPMLEKMMSGNGGGLGALMGSLMGNMGGGMGGFGGMGGGMGGRPF